MGGRHLWPTQYRPLCRGKGLNDHVRADQAGADHSAPSKGGQGMGGQERQKEQEGMSVSRTGNRRRHRAGSWQGRVQGQPKPQQKRKRDNATQHNTTSRRDPPAKHGIARHRAGRNDKTKAQHTIHQEARTHHTKATKRELHDITLRRQQGTPQHITQNRTQHHTARHNTCTAHARKRRHTDTQTHRHTETPKHNPTNT